MPTYVYECSNCNDVFEVEQRITEDPLTDCKCGSKGTVKRLIQPVGVMFKGAGFHINDYSALTASKTPATPSSDKPDKTEAKPEPKAPETPASTT